MSDGPVLIKRYPNRRYYAHNTSKYVSLQEIEEIVQEGHRVEIRDSQSGDDLTRAVLTQIIMERHPDKMSLFPVDMLHFVLRSNDAMTDLLRDYFRHSLTYLHYLQRHSAVKSVLVQPMHWVQVWLRSVSPKPVSSTSGETDSDAAPESDPLVVRVRELEERLRQLESNEP